jgi:hypothetical protein
VVIDVAEKEAARRPVYDDPDVATHERGPEDRLQVPQDALQEPRESPLQPVPSNNIYARNLRELGRLRGAPARIALPVSGDSPAAKAVVLQLVDAMGFDPVDAGGLDDSWRQQPGTPVYCKDLDADGLRRALAQARPERTAEWRAAEGSPGGFANPG